MGLWIRSKDKTVLINAKTLFVAGTEIRCYYNDNPNWFIGEYKTEERALEVLNEIEQRLIDLQTLEIAPNSYQTIKRNVNCVYDMPQE